MQHGHNRWYSCQAKEVEGFCLQIILFDVITGFPKGEDEDRLHRIGIF